MKLGLLGCRFPGSWILDPGSLPAFLELELDCSLYCFIARVAEHSFIGASRYGFGS